MEIFIYFGGGGPGAGGRSEKSGGSSVILFSGGSLSNKAESFFEGTNVKKYSQKRVDGNLFFFIKSEKQFYTFGKILIDTKIN